MVVFDASILLLVLDEDAKASVPRARKRVEYLIDCLDHGGEKIIIPTPALSECLVHAGPAGPEYLAIISKRACSGSQASMSAQLLRPLSRPSKLGSEGKRGAAIRKPPKPKSNLTGRSSRLPKSKEQPSSIQTTKT